MSQVHKGGNIRRLPDIIKHGGPPAAEIKTRPRTRDYMTAEQTIKANKEQAAEDAALQEARQGVQEAPESTPEVRPMSDHRKLAEALSGRLADPEE